jgi:hypothetical protein
MILSVIHQPAIRDDSMIHIVFDYARLNMLLEDMA